MTTSLHLHSLSYFISSNYHIGAPGNSTVTDCRPSVSLYTLLGLPITSFLSGQDPAQDHHRAGIMWVVDHSQYYSGTDEQQL